jgi:hypothetical protein
MRMALAGAAIRFQSIDPFRIGRRCPAAHQPRANPFTPTATRKKAIINRTLLACIHQPDWRHHVTRIDAVRRAALVIVLPFYLVAENGASQPGPFQQGNFATDRLE